MKHWQDLTIGFSIYQNQILKGCLKKETKFGFDKLVNRYYKIDFNQGKIYIKKEDDSKMFITVPFRNIIDCYQPTGPKYFDSFRYAFCYQDIDMVVHTLYTVAANECNLWTEGFKYLISTTK